MQSGVRINEALWLTYADQHMLLFTNCTLLLTDEEFSEYLSEINQVTVKYMKQETSESSKMRRITLISAPTNE